METPIAAESALEKAAPEPGAGATRRKRRRDGLARRAVQLEVARDLFLQRGYGETSVNEVARIAGGSLATLYREFGNKEGLFLAVVQEYFHDEVPPLEAVLDADISLADGLQVIGEGYVKALLEPDRIALTRIFVSEGRQIPHLMRRFQNFSEESSRGLARRLLDKHVEAGSIRPVDTKWTASYFIEMLRTHHFVTAMYNPRYVLLPEDRREHVARAVDLICYGLVPPGAAPRAGLLGPRAGQTPPST
jgi:AcrR family transcriptional regulator